MSAPPSQQAVGAVAGFAGEAMATAVMSSLARGATNGSTGGWSGALYSGRCWQLHSMRGLPLPGVGLANTLFGFLAACSFLIILHLVLAARRRARRKRRRPTMDTAPSEASSSGWGRTRSGGNLLASFNSLGAPFNPAAGGGGDGGATSTGEGNDSSDGGDGLVGSVSFSSYVKFLFASSCWALLWVMFNLLPTLSSEREDSTLLWHALVASLVYTASVFLELAVVVFLLHGNIGQQAFRTAACVTGLVALIYGSCNFYFRLGDIALARGDPDYPIAQLDFISTHATMLFLAISSATIAAFFLTTAAVGHCRWRRAAAAGSAVATAAAAAAAADSAGSKRSRERQRRNGKDKNKDKDKDGGVRVALTESVPRGYGGLGDASAPLLISPKPSSSTVLDGNILGSSGGSSSSMETKEENNIISPNTVPSSTSSLLSRLDSNIVLVHPAESTAAPTAALLSSSASTLLLKVSATSASESASPSTDPSRSPSPSVLRTRSRQHLSPTPLPVSPMMPMPPVPQRSSAVYYSLFLALYYCIKTVGVSLLYGRHDAGICVLDGGILLYFLVYAFLLYYTLVQDSRYWHTIFTLAQMQMHLHHSHNQDDASSRLLTENSTTGNAVSPRGRADSGSRGNSPSRGSRQLLQKLLLGSSPSSRRNSRENIVVAASAPVSSVVASSLPASFGPKLADVAVSLPSASSSLPKSRSNVGRDNNNKNNSTTVLLKDYIIPSNQLVRVRLLRVAESVPSALAAGSGGAGSHHHHASSRSGRGSRNKRGSPVLSRSGSGSGAGGAGAAKWSLAGVSSRVSRAMAGASGSGSSSWSDSSFALYLARWKGGPPLSCRYVAVKQFTLPSITPEFFTQGDFQAFVAAVPMGLWIGRRECMHDNLARCLGVSVDPPCVSIVLEFGITTLYDALHGTIDGVPTIPAGHNAGAAGGGMMESPLAPVYLPLAGSSASAAAAAAAAVGDIMPASPGLGTRLMRAASIGSNSGGPGSPSGTLSSNSGLSIGGLGGSPQQAPQSARALLPLLCPYRLSLELASAMAHLQRWVGYDAHPLHLSPANILLDEGLHAKIADLNDFYAAAIAAAAGGDHHHHSSSRTSSSSSRKRAAHLSQPAWQSPEMLAGTPPSRASAVYSFGVILWQLLTWTYPCVLVPREQPQQYQDVETSRRSAAFPIHGRHHGRGSIVRRAPSPSRSYSYSYSPSAGSSLGVSVSSYPVQAPLASLVDVRSSSLLAAAALSSHASNTDASILKSSARDEPAGVGLSSGGGPLGLGGASAAAAAAAAEDRTPPSSPGHSVPSSPTTLSDNDDDHDASDDEDAAAAAAAEAAAATAAANAVVYDCIPLSDLKLAQRYVLSEGRRPPLPLGIPPAVSRLLEYCWDENPDDRPSFDIIVDYLQAECADELARMNLPLQLPASSSSSSSSSAAAMPASGAGGAADGALPGMHSVHIDDDTAAYEVVQAVRYHASMRA